MNDKEFRHFLELATIPLREIGPEGLPINYASGCLVDYGKRRWILTVSHATGNYGNWAIEVEYGERGMGLHRIGAMNFVALIHADEGKSGQLDMAYATVPPKLTPHWQPANDRGEIVADELKIVFKSALGDIPSPDRRYGFAGNVQPSHETHFGKVHVATMVRSYTGLTFVGEDDKFYHFRLTEARGGDEFFKGTSGSAVCDTDGNPVALVCGPGDEPDTVRAIKIGFFRTAIDATIRSESSTSTE